VIAGFIQYGITQLVGSPIVLVEVNLALVIGMAIAFAGFLKTTLPDLERAYRQLREQ